MSQPPLKPPAPYRLAPLTADHIPAVLEIEQVAKPSPWTAASYHAELNNPNGRPRVLLIEQQSGQASISPSSRSNPTANAVVQQLRGYIVPWLIADELQIATIAVHHQWRRHGLGELLLWDALHYAHAQNALLATLEVRQSNTAAQHLYRRYGFETVAERPNYYRDNGETALLMNAEPLGQTLADRLRQRRPIVLRKLQSGRVS